VRIVSLLPAATEIVAALGGAIGDPPRPGVPGLVGVSHACDYPPEVRGLPRVTATGVDVNRSCAVIDREITTIVTGGAAPVITVDAAQLARLAPDLLIGQGVCEVCAVGETDLTRVLAALSMPPQVVTLHAHTIEGVLEDIRRVGRALDLVDEAIELVAGMRYRFRRVRERHTAIATRAVPRTVVLEWLDPPYVAGHWVPELVALAGGRDVGNAPGARSARRGWGELVRLAPDRLIVALCGFDVPRARREVASLRERDARRLLTRGVEFLDGNAYTSRPGPRLVEAAERLALLLGG
jgi:iron complex transport system substrate-binding protein